MADVYGFETVSSQGYNVTKSEEEVKNLPPIMSQDTIGICYAFAASTILTAENCRATGNSKCNQVNSDQVFSPLALASYGRVSDSSAKAKKSVPSQDGLPGGSIANTLQGATYTNGGAPSEACMSLDKVLSRLGGAKEAQQFQAEAWERLKGLYDKSKALPKGCDSCTSDFYATAQGELEKNFDVKISNDRLLKAFAQDTYSRFFDMIMTPKECKNPLEFLRLVNEDKVEVKTYPPNGTKGNYNGAIENIKMVLGQGKLLGLGSLCLDLKPSESSCQSMHGVAIAGYRKVCKGNSTSDCRDVVKVINSWGDSWQRRNDDGWVDARKLLDRTFYGEGTLAWLSDTK